MKKIAKKSKNKLSIGQILPRKLGQQRKEYFAARADSFGTTILNRHGGKGNYSMFTRLSMVGVVCTVLMITTGYGTKDLELQKYIKLCGIIQIPRHYTRVVGMSTLFFMQKKRLKSRF